MVIAAIGELKRFQTVVYYIPYLDSPSKRTAFARYRYNKLNYYIKIRRLVDTKIKIETEEM